MPTPMPHVQGVEHRYVDVAGLRVHVAEAGPPDAPPVVLLHGWPQHWYAWRHVIPRLAATHRLICPDLRGHGWTDAPEDGYEKEQLADDLLGLLDVLGHERVGIVGHDWGGWTAFLACLRAPHRFRAFLALNIAHPFVRAGNGSLSQLPRLWYQVALSTPGLGTSVLERLPGAVERAILLGSEHREGFSAEALRSFSEPLREPARARASARLYRTFLLREVGPVLAGRYRRERLRTPTLLLFGTGDPAITVPTLRGFEPYADDMRLELVEGCGHFIAEELPDLVADRAGALL